ncbi:hypothetical protein FMZ60_07860 [Alcaligenaceae bacterium SJ-26]|nr:hypothetical protein FMZ60_07860 [Alcaligenaceae bacterium SJ-26]
MKPHTIKPKRVQLDFWPELLNKGMVHYALLAGSTSKLHPTLGWSEPLPLRACPQRSEDSREVAVVTSCNQPPVGGVQIGAGNPPLSKTGRNGEAVGMGVKQ